MGSRQVISDLARLVDAVRAADTNQGSLLHGEIHWKCVAWTGLELADEVEHADREVVLLFGLFHDSQRKDDGHDRDHGRRAAKLVERMHGEHFRLHADRLAKLIDACAGHADGTTSDDPTIGLCWDADRLNLWRIGVTPQARFLSTVVARRESSLERSRQMLGQRMSWTEIARRIDGG